MKTNLIERRVGTREKPPKRITLRAGALTVDFVAGGLRNIRYEGHEVLRAIAYVVRNADWGTYTPEMSDCTIQKGWSGIRNYLSGALRFGGRQPDPQLPGAHYRQCARKSGF